MKATLFIMMLIWLGLTRLAGEQKNPSYPFKLTIVTLSLSMLIIMGYLGFKILKNNV